jgi:microcystin-dependent protein
MANDPFLASIMVISWNFPPKGWALCNGQILPINQNQALFSLLGTTYGGNGQTTFALPDLRGRVPIGFSADGTFSLGEAAGQEAVTLTPGQIPAHGHTATASTQNPLAATGLACSDATADRRTPAGSGLAREATNVTALYTAATPNAEMRADAVRFGGAGAIGAAGGGQAHNNVQPSLALNFCIALSGSFPSQVQP